MIMWFNVCCGWEGSIHILAGIKKVFSYFLFLSFLYHPKQGSCSWVFSKTYTSYIWWSFLMLWVLRPLVIGCLYYYSHRLDVHILSLKTIFLNGVMQNEYLTRCGCCAGTGCKFCYWGLKKITEGFCGC